jgi:hypothetical protein
VAFEQIPGIEDYYPALCRSLDLGQQLDRYVNKPGFRFHQRISQVQVAITFLQHNHPSVPRYERNSWTFTKGALSTIDRDFGWAGRFFFHNVIDFHVVHHLFS